MRIKFKRKIKLIIAGILSIAAIAVVGYYSFAKYYLAEDMIEAQNALKAGNNILANKLLQKVIKNDSSNVEAHKLLAGLNQKMGNYLQAVKLWASVQKLDPFDQEAVEMQVENMFTIGAYKAIIELLEERFKEDKCTLNEEIYLAKSYSALGEIDLSEKIANKILKTKKNIPAAILLKGNLAFYRKHIKQAEELYNQIETDNKDILCAKYIGIANCLEYKGDSKEAENLYIKADNLLDHSVQTSLILADFYEKNKQNNKALKLLESLYKEDKNNINIITTLANLYLQAGDTHKIDLLKRQITKSGILFIQTKYFLDALILFLNKKYIDTLRYFEWTGDKFKNNFAYRACTIYSYIKTENIIETAKYLKSIFNSNIPVDEKNKIIDFAIAEAQEAFLKNNFEFTYKICSIISQYDFSYIPAHVLTMWYYFNKGRLREAEVEANIVLKANSDDINAIEVKGRIVLNANNFKEARHLFKKLIELSSESPLGYYWMGITYLKEKKYDKSLKYLQKSFDIQPDNLMLIGALYDLYLLTDDENSISVLCSNLLKSDKQSIQALGYIYKAEQSLRKGNSKEAVVYYQNAVKLTPENIPYYLYLAKTLNKLNRFKEAVSILSKADKISKDNKFILFELAYTYYRDNNLQASERIFRKILEEYPDWVLPMINLSQILSTRKDKLMESLELAKRAVRITPSSYLSRYNLGEILFLNKKYNESLEEFKSALSYRPNDPNTLEYCKKIEKKLAQNKKQ